MIVKKIYEEIYGTEITVIFKAKRAEALQYLEKRGFKEEEIGQEAFADGTLFTLSETIKGRKYQTYIIWIEHKTLGTVAHEVMHLVIRVLTNKGIPISQENSEVMAYLYEWWLMQVWDIKVTEKKKGGKHGRTTKRTS